MPKHKGKKKMKVKKFLQSRAHLAEELTLGDNRLDIELFKEFPDFLIKGKR